MQVKATIRDNAKPVIQSRSTDHVPMELAAVALVQLYYRDDHRRVYYDQKRRGFSLFIRDCADGVIIPEATALQAKLTDLLGTAREAHLYIPRYEGDSPTHYVSLLKGDDGLWRARHHKIRAAPNRISYGALISWRPITPVPGVCIETTPGLTPISKGKTAFDQFITEATSGSDRTAYLTRRELSHSAIIMRLFGEISRNTLAVWFPDRRDAYSDSCTRIGLSINPGEADGWLDPYTFEYLSLRRSVPFAGKRNVSIVATPRPIEDTGLLHSFMPTTSKLEPVEDHLLGETRFVLEQMLKTRLVPYIGITLDGSYVDLYAMFFYADTGTPEIVKVAEHRRIANCESLPVIKPWKKYDGFWIPNDVLVHVLRHLALSDEKFIFNSVGRAMTYFGAAKLESYNKVFKRYGCQFTDRELELMQAATGISTSSQDGGRPTTTRSTL